jgi:hypothetical protein
MVDPAFTDIVASSYYRVSFVKGPQRELQRKSLALQSA